MTIKNRYFLCIAAQSFSQWTRSQKTLFSILLTIIALLTIGLITLFIMYLHKSVSNNEETLLEENISTIFGEKSVCTSVQCVQSAAEILNSMDKKIDPCEDFYGFACNGWISNNPIPKVS
jgi:endothelin-converting enzyme